MTLTVDSSVIVAAFAGWHEDHELALQTLATSRPRLIGHCALESYSVLTRLPYPHRAPGSLVAEFLAAQFPEAPLGPSPGLWASALGVFREAGIRGGAVYDGLVGLVAAENDLELLSLDRRAGPTYRACGVAYRLLRP